jgi:hypothetical protein
MVLFLSDGRESATFKVSRQLSDPAKVLDTPSKQASRPQHKADHSCASRHNIKLGAATPQVTI